MKVVLCNCPSTTDVYKQGKLRAVVPQIPLISLASLAGALLEDNHDVVILDLANISNNPLEDVADIMATFEPDFFGITFTTPLVDEAKQVIKTVKFINKDCHTMAGGVHPTVMPHEIAAYMYNGRRLFDAVLIGEGERAIKNIVKHKPSGVVWPVGHIENLDDLPRAAWELFDIKKYKAPRIMARKTPLGAIETSRGCYGVCTYCSGPIMHGRAIRVKSVDRVLSDVNHMLNVGFKELHVWDDSFTYDVDRAMAVMKGMVDYGVDVPIRLDCGIRVNSVFNRPDFFDLIAKTSIYGLAYGYESGNQRVLDSMRKGTTIEQAIKSTRMSQQYDVEIVGFFMIGLLGDTPSTIEDTINFACELDPTYAKFTVMTPFPGTTDFDTLDKSGSILTKDWTKYNFHSDSVVYKHPHPELTHDFLWKKYNDAHNRFYFRPKKILDRVLYDIKRGPLFALSDAKTAFLTFSK